MCVFSQVRAHQLVLPPCDVVIKAVADYVRNIQDTTDLDAIAKDVFQHSQVKYGKKYFFKQLCTCTLHLCWRIAFNKSSALYHLI